MALDSLFHVAIKSKDLQRTLRFYTEVLELISVPRPKFDFPGLWLATPGSEHAPLIHVYGGDAALEVSGNFAASTGVVDHVSILARGFSEFRSRLERFGLSWRANIVPDAGLWQLFVYDPSAVLLELTFQGSREDGVTPSVPVDRQYRPREIFFAETEYD